MKTKTILTILAVVMLLAMLLNFDFVAEPLGKMVGKPADAVKSIAKTIMFTALGLTLIYFGVLALTAMAVAGIALIVVGGFLLVQIVWPMISPPKAG